MDDAISNRVVRSARRFSLAISDRNLEGYSLLLGVGNSLKFLKRIPDKSVKLVVSSPPYNIGKSYETILALDKYLRYYRIIAKEIYRILKEDGSLAWQVGNYVYNGEIFPLDIFFYEIFKGIKGFKLRNRIIWRFEHGLHSSSRLSGRYETILWFTKSDSYTFNLDLIRIPQKYPGKTFYKGRKKGELSCNPLGKNPGDVWNILIDDWEEQIWDIPNVKFNHPEKTTHPAQFPVELVQRLVLALTDEGDLILDPFGGVGSSAIAALSLGRKAISIDKNEDYSHIALERATALIRGDLKIRNICNRIYEPSPSSALLRIPQEWQELRKALYLKAINLLMVRNDQMITNLSLKRG